MQNTLIATILKHLFGINTLIIVKVTKLITLIETATLSSKYVNEH